MSKAFTSEETPDTGPVLRTPPRLAPGEIRYVTPEGHAALRRELAALPAGDPRAVVLERTLAALTVLGPEAAPEGKAGFGCWVEVEDEGGTRRTYRIVGPDEADPKRGLVSAHAPVGAALLGHEVEDVVEVQRPGGSTELTLVAIRRTPSGT